MATVGERLYDLWAPEKSVWSPWAKPVLFANSRTPPGIEADSPAEPLPGTDWAPDVSRRMAIVAELPGADSVRVGLALAKIGYRPVPLFNAAHGSRAALEQDSIQKELSRGAATLAGAAIEPDAPPVFLLDWRRCRVARSTVPGTLDNRWICFPQDFPSAQFLKEQRIGDVLLLQNTVGQPQEDLAHVLRRWQEAGIGIYVDTMTPGGAVPLEVTKPPQFRALLYRVLAMIGYKRNSAGGFGGVVPEPTQSSGYSGYG